MLRLPSTLATVLAATLSFSALPAAATIIDLTIDGTDVIFLAGRTDVVIPDAGDPWVGPGTYIPRHGGPTPEELKETFPSVVSVVAGDVVKVANPAVGGVSFYNGFGGLIFGPDGDGLTGSEILPLDGISGYKGPQGPLVGVFLGNDIPSSGPAPATLDFSAGGLGIDFTVLIPELGQIFYMGDGLTTALTFQAFVAPVGATRLFLGIPDAFAFQGEPSAYDDNDGSYRVRLGINEDPVQTPAPAAVGLLGLGLMAVARSRRAR